MGRPKKEETTVSTTTDLGVTNPDEKAPTTTPEPTIPAVEDKSKETKKDGLEEVTLLKRIVVDDIEYPQGSKMKATKEGKAGLISIGALK